MYCLPLIVVVVVVVVLVMLLLTLWSLLGLSSWSWSWLSSWSASALLIGALTSSSELLVEIILNRYSIYYMRFVSII